MSLFRFAALIAALGMMSQSPVAAAPPDAAQRDWSTTVAPSPYGGVVIGNPDAADRLVEYISYTCPHCAHFASESATALKSQFIATGTTSVEIRPFLRNAPDYAASLLASCGGPQAYPANHAAILATQPQWLARLQRTAAERQRAWVAGDAATGIAMIVADSGLDAVMTQRGFTAAQIAACIADDASMQAIQAGTRHAMEVVGIDATPSFTLNDRLLANTHDWAGVRAALIVGQTRP